VAKPDPYQRWSGAPKHWVEIPAQRQSPPSFTAPGIPHPVRSTVPPRSAMPSRAVLAALAVTVTALLLSMTGPGSSVADLDQPAGPATPTAR
jgi:hypothetical protein